MEYWKRIFSGLWPYRWSVVLSMICALGVGLSYASGVATMLPVMKIFISAEGIHGWANRLTAEKRLHLDLFDLDTSVRQAETYAMRAAKMGQTQGTQAHALTIMALQTKVAKSWWVGAGGETSQLANLASGDRITKVVVGDQEVSDWQAMVRQVALAPAHTPVTLEIQPAIGGTLTRLQASLAKPIWPLEQFVRLIDRLPAQPTQALIWVVVFFVALCVIGSTFRYYQQYLGTAVAVRVVMDIRRRAYDRLVQLPVSHFAQRGTSDMTSRLTQDTNSLTDGVGMVLGKSVQEPIKALLAAGLALWLNWWLCVMIVITVPILGVIIRKFSKRLRRASHRALESWSRMLGVIEEALGGVRVVKAYSAEGYERRRFARINKELLKEQMKITHYAALSRPTIETLAILASAVPMVMAADLVLKGTVEKETFFTLLACFAAILEPLRKLSDVNSKFQQANASAKRIFEIIDLEPEANYSHSLPHLARHRQSIVFEQISFQYPGHKETVLHQVDLSVRHGQVVAVVGSNGSGKTTLLSLLPRLYVPVSGRVLIDGVDTAGVSLASLRRQIGLVTQDTVLFADTIYNNIAYGTRHATREAVMEASKRAFADEFITTFPEGYETRIGEHGVRLSGGQKQRIAIARAILHDPAILILDEAMSQIDSDSEMKISMALREFTRHRTSFVIAHRFATVVEADLICCLDAGRVVGLGTHQQLLGTCPPYRKLYETQFREVG